MEDRLNVSAQPIAELTAHRHPLLDESGIHAAANARLGERGKNDKGTEYPKETDHFVLKEEDGFSPAAIRAYGGNGGIARPKHLFVMLAAEAPYPGRRFDDDDLAFQVRNLAFSFHGLICQGTGGDKGSAGVAICKEDAFAKVITDRIQAQPQRLDDGRLSFPCLGLDCPQFRRMVPVRKDVGGKAKTVDEPAPGHLPGAPCKLMVRFKFLLLDPSTWDTQPGNILATAQIVSGSIRTILGLRDDLHAIRRHTFHPKFGLQLPDGPQGRTAWIPFIVERLPKKGVRGGGVSTHFPLSVRPTPTVWGKWSRVPREIMFLDPATLHELEALYAADREISLEAARDIVPRPAELLASSTTDFAELDDEVHGRRPVSVPQGTVPTGAGATPDEAVNAAANGPEPDPELDQQVDKGMLRELKQLLGADLPGGAFENPDEPDLTTKPEVTERLRAQLRAYAVAHNTTLPSGFRISNMTVRMYRWIKATLTPAAEQAAADDDDRVTDPDDEPIDGVQQGLNV